MREETKNLIYQYCTTLEDYYDYAIPYIDAQEWKTELKESYKNYITNKYIMGCYERFIQSLKALDLEVSPEYESIKFVNGLFCWT